MKAETGDHDIGPTGSDDDSQGKGKSLRPRSIPCNFRHLNELANVGHEAPSLVNASSERAEEQPELISLFTTYGSLGSKIQCS